MKTKNEWIRAEKHLKGIRQRYTDIGTSGIFGLTISINPILIRFEKGDRTNKLYNDIMKLE